VNRILRAVDSLMATPGLQAVASRFSTIHASLVGPGDTVQGQ
jgi:hypothetical protein